MRIQNFEYNIRNDYDYLLFMKMHKVFWFLILYVDCKLYLS